MINMRDTLLVLGLIPMFVKSASVNEASYAVLTVKDRQPPPFSSVQLTLGPIQMVDGHPAQWVQMAIRTDTPTNRVELCAVRWLRRGSPFGTPPTNESMLRYQLRIPETGESLEFRQRHTGRALLPRWTDFERQFLPLAARGSGWRGDFPETCECLGHVLTLQRVSNGVLWEDWNDTRLLILDDTLLVGNSRPFKDREGRRLPQHPQRQDYSYVAFDDGDYQRMCEAGFNLFTIKPDQEPWVRSRPVFYLREAGGQPPLRYPADLYRANYLGPVMFMDEPSILMVGDTNIHRTLHYFSDAAALIRKRTALTFGSDGPYGAHRLARSLAGRGLNLGDLHLAHEDYPSWETLYETAFYQMEGGGAGIVHEGRYQLASFNEAAARFTGISRQHTPAEMLTYHFAFLRGGAHPFGKSWGTAIYGQCDTNLAPLALTLAYDMGARYLWFWSSDHDHHLPWLEQLDLARHLRAHEKAHPRVGLSRTHTIDVAITIPYGYFVSLDALWWVRVMDKEGRNDASRKYQRLVKAVLEAAHECYAQGLTYDITVDRGTTPAGYRRVVRLSAE